jgi:hypothetical protein
MLKSDVIFINDKPAFLDYEVGDTHFEHDGIKYLLCYSQFNGPSFFVGPNFETYLGDDVPDEVWQMYVEWLDRNFYVVNSL